VRRQISSICLVKTVCDVRLVAPLELWRKLQPRPFPALPCTRAAHGRQTRNINTTLVSRTPLLHIWPTNIRYNKIARNPSTTIRKSTRHKSSIQYASRRRPRDCMCYIAYSRTSRECAKFMFDVVHAKPNANTTCSSSRNAHRTSKSQTTKSRSSASTTLSPPSPPSAHNTCNLCNPSSARSLGPTKHLAQTTITQYRNTMR
jgi:hypothetical protein